MSNILQMLVTLCPQTVEQYKPLHYVVIVLILFHRSVHRCARTLHGRPCRICQVRDSVQSMCTDVIQMPHRCLRDVAWLRALYEHMRCVHMYTDNVQILTDDSWMCTDVARTSVQSMQSPCNVRARVDKSVQSPCNSARTCTDVHGLFCRPLLKPSDQDLLNEPSNYYQTRSSIFCHTPVLRTTCIDFV